MAENPVFKPENALGEALCVMETDELLVFVKKLCKFASENCTETGFRGGFRPGNISYEKGKIAVGPAGKSGEDWWSKDELEFMSPELFWYGTKTASADVYSIGLLLYYALNGGKLPFIPDTEGEPGPDDRVSALKLRMNGKPVTAPQDVDDELKSIIEKAVDFKAENRYANTSELLDALIAYSGEIPVSEEETADESVTEDAEPENESDDIQEEAPEDLLQLDDIIDEFKSADAPVEYETQDEEAESTEDEVKSDEEDEIPEEPEVQFEEASPASESEEEQEVTPVKKIEEESSVPEKTEPKIIEVEVVSRDIPETEDTETAPVETAPVKKKKIIGKIALALVICAAIAGIAIAIANSKAKVPEIVDKTPAPTAEATTEPTDTPPTAPVMRPEAVSTYQLFSENVSWDEAESNCVEMGGHLVTIDSLEEFNEICALLSETNAQYVWVGCHRNADGELLWASGDAVEFYNWAEGEPSCTDSYDGAAEDYIMLVKQADGTWMYNDSRIDPMAKYSKYYGGKIAYICEITE